ncbi:MAG: putative glycoside hydrolase, partial [Bacteroidota bacterium]|nr:putative glycoside hydrolase [Bacteroidota bacterium]
MNKRDFIKTLGFAAAGVAIANSSSALPLFFKGDRKSTWPEIWTWMGGNPSRSDDEWKSIFEKLHNAGFGGVLFESGVELLARVAPFAQDAGIELHSWMWTLNRPADEEAKKHKDWYVVNRNGESCYDKHPYVEYYQWLCPSKEEVFQHIEKDALSRVRIPGVSGVHLDYVRYPDIILPKALQPHYGLVQDHEMPEYDFCYCETCREKYMQKTGMDILTLPNPDLDEQWKQYRYDSVTRFVNRLAKLVHKQKKVISAAVFPYPELARTICRQSWNDWNLDAFFPMIYQNFYEEDIPWIGKATRNGVRDLKGKAHLFSGFFLPDLPNEGDLSQAIHEARSNGANGISIFEYEGLKEYQWQEIK